ncbi:hypothetical protein MTP03_40140 [Tsukamurella sp. PLM1]|nr:hypothetical protein MTP03_40140 [Tsukamurella sp. PLM1]
MSKSLSVSATGLRKCFGRSIALDGLDLAVEEGEVHGFLGPNGAGKSTTIRALLGQLRLDGGEARVFGLDPRRDASTVHDRLAYVPGDVSLWPGLSGGECIDVLGGLQGHLDPRRRDELIERFELDPRRRHAPIRRATGRRWHSSQPLPATRTCTSSTNPPPGSTR